MKPFTWVVVAIAMASCGSPQPASHEQVPPREAPVAEQPAPPPEPPKLDSKQETPRKKAVKKRPAPAVFGTKHEMRAGKLVNVDALVLNDFRERVDRYVSQQKKSEGGPAKIKETRDPAKIKNSQQELAGRIRERRANAAHGDIFTPEIRDAFIRLLSPQTKGTAGKLTKEIVKDDAPSAVPLKANADYPPGAPLPTVPVNVLRNLPRLPDGIEYRIVGKNLILRDVKANTIIDFIPNAIH